MREAGGPKGQSIFYIRYDEGGKRAGIVFSDFGGKVGVEVVVQMRDGKTRTLFLRFKFDEPAVQKVDDAKAPRPIGAFRQGSTKKLKHMQWVTNQQTAA